MDRKVESLAQCRDQLGGGGRTQQTRHVLDRDDVRAGVDDLVREAQVVVEGVEVFRRIQQIAGVAERHFGDGGPRVADRLDRRTHLLHVVERVEDAEDVDATGSGLRDERLGHGRGVRRVADRVATAQQHLDRHVGQRRTEFVEALPGVLAEEAQRDVVGGTAPCLDREQTGSEPRQVRRRGDQVLRAHTRGQERLVRVAERGVGDRQGRLRTEAAGEALRSQFGGAGANPAPARKSGRRQAAW